MRTETRYGRAASTQETCQVLSNAILTYWQAWNESCQLDAIIKEGGLKEALSRIAEDLPALFKKMPSSFQFYVGSNKRKKGEYLKQ